MSKIGNAGISSLLSSLTDEWVTVRFSEGPFFRRFIVPKVHCSEGSLFRKKGLLCRRFIVPKGHLSEIGVHCSEGSLFRRFIVPK